MPTEKEVLDEFGRLIVKQRDIAVLHHEWAAAGQGSADGYANRHLGLAQLTSDQLAM